MGERYKLPISVQLLVEKDNKILLLKRQNTGYEDGKYSLPGGHIEPNEEVRKAVIREAKEEIGIDINMEDVKFYKVLNRKISNNGEYVDFIFKTNTWEGNIINKEEDKCEEIIWADKDNLPENILAFIPTLLKDKSSYLPYNWEEN